MSAEIKRLIDKWINDKNFRTSIRKDPEGTIRKMNITLTTDETAAFRAIDWGQSDEALTARASKLA